MATAQKPKTKDAKKINQKVIGKSKSSSDGAADNMNTGISEENTGKVADALNEVLADEFLLYVKTLNFHWNIEGRDFHALHLFLDEQYHQLQVIIDAVAERIRKVGHFATGSMQEFLNNTSLQEHSGAASVAASAGAVASWETVSASLAGSSTAVSASS